MKHESQELKKLKEGIEKMPAEDLAKEIHEAFEVVKVEMGFVVENEPFKFSEVPEKSREVMIRVSEELLLNLDKVFKRAEEKLKKLGSDKESQLGT